MKRKQLKELHIWLNNPRRKPLVLRGARQVGKSTLVRLFSKEIELELVEINLELHRDLNRVFESLDLERIIQNLSSVAGKQINSGTLLFLDEIQATPQALAALRYFYEQRPDIALVAAGSLLEFTLKEHSFSMPVGRIQYLHLGPMTYFEFLEETDPYLFSLMENFSLARPLPEASHKKLISSQRDFMLTGGMPEAVLEYKESRSFSRVKDVHRSIGNTYMDDFSKYAQSGYLADLQSLFRKIPAQVGKKVKYVNLLPNARSAYTANMLELLSNARVISKIHTSDLSGIPLGAGKNEKKFKLLFLDVGLLSAMLGLDIIDLQGLTERELLNEGTLAEQYVGQHLLEGNSSDMDSGLYYWMREASKSNAEVDFAIARGMQIFPIEVKSGLSGSLKSLHQLMFEKQLLYAFRFDLQPHSVQEIETKVSTKDGLKDCRYTLVTLPLYAVEKIPSVIDNIRQGSVDPVP